MPARSYRSKARRLRHRPWFIVCSIGTPNVLLSVTNPARMLWGVTAAMT